MFVIVVIVLWRGGRRFISRGRKVVLQDRDLKGERLVSRSAYCLCQLGQANMRAVNVKQSQTLANKVNMPSPGDIRAVTRGGCQPCSHGYQVHLALEMRGSSSSSELR